MKVGSATICAFLQECSKDLTPELEATLMDLNPNDELPNIDEEVEKEIGDHCFPEKSAQQSFANDKPQHTFYKSLSVPERPSKIKELLLTGNYFKFKAGFYRGVAYTKLAEAIGNKTGNYVYGFISETVTHEDSYLKKIQEIENSRIKKDRKWTQEEILKELRDLEDLSTVDYKKITDQVIKIITPLDG